MAAYELIIGALCCLAGIGIGAWILYTGIRIGVNLATRPEAFPALHETRTEMDGNTQ